MESALPERLDRLWLISLAMASVLATVVLWYLGSRGLHMTGVGLVVNAVLYLWIGVGLTVWLGWVIHAGIDDHLVVPTLVTGGVLARTFAIFREARPHDPGILFVVWFVPFLIAVAGGTVERRLRDRYRRWKRHRDGA